MAQQELRGEVDSVPGVVAIVEDDSQISLALGVWLELHGLRATSYPTAESLLKAIHSKDGVLSLDVGVNRPVEIHLLGAVLDLNLPGINGIDLAYALRHLMPDLPIAIITALCDEDRNRYGKPPPGIHCLKKPFDLDALEHALFPLLH